MSSFEPTRITVTGTTDFLNQVQDLSEEYTRISQQHNKRRHHVALVFGHAGFKEKNVLELVRRATDLRQRVYDRGGSTAERRERVEFNELEELYQELRKNMNLLNSELKKSFPDGPSSGWAEFRKEVDEVFKPYFQLSTDDHPPRITDFLAQSSLVSPSSQIEQSLPQSPVPGDGEGSIFEIDQGLANYVTPDAASFLARDNIYRPSHPLHLLNARVPFWVAGASQHASSNTVSGVDDLETSPSTSFYDA